MNVEHDNGCVEPVFLGSMPEAPEIAGDAFRRGGVRVTVSEGTGDEIRVTILWDRPFRRGHVELVPDPRSVPAA